MPALHTRPASFSVFAIVVAVLWGLVEFVALCRSRWAAALTQRAKAAPPSSP